LPGHVHVARRIKRQGAALDCASQISRKQEMRARRIQLEEEAVVPFVSLGLKCICSWKIYRWGLSRDVCLARAVDCDAEVVIPPNSPEKVEGTAAADVS